MPPATLVDLLRERAGEGPGATAYVFLTDGEQQEVRLTLGELDRAARAIGARLQALGAAGEPVALMEPPGLGFVAAFFGCLYAGAVAVPLFPPDAERSRGRVRAVLADARPALVVAPAPVLAALRADAGLANAALRGLAPEEVDGGLAERWTDPGLTAADTALVQYTSGSTASPRGVRLTHGNVLHNQEAIRRAFGHTRESVVVSWLPLYHDMGLIGTFLQPLYNRMRLAVLMSPLDVWTRPARWLRAVSRYRATTSGGPDSAYERCVRKIAPEELRGCDLSSWQVAFNGSEPVRAETLERFAAAFAPFGFRREALYPCYGLAEATLIVAGGPPGRAPVVRWIEEGPLERGMAVAATGPGPGRRALVSCGRSVAGQRLEIVDPETAAVRPPGEVGEIWVAGPSVAAGYWRQGEDEGVFTGRLPDGEGPFLRTGDLGFLLDGELYVTGRRKDLIIVRGRNLHPQDVERTVEQCDPAVRAGSVAAFPLEMAGEEGVGIACEVDGRRVTDPQELIARLVREVAAAHGAAPVAVALLPPRALPKTSSGKVQRRLCRASLLDGSLPVLAAWHRPTGADVEEEGGRPAAEAPATAGGPGAPGEAGDWLAAQVAARTGLAATAIDRSRPLSSYGLDSLHLAELVAAVEDRSGRRIPWASLLADPSAADLEARLAVAPPLGDPAGDVWSTVPAGHAGTAGESFLPARESRLLLLLARRPVWYLFRRHFHAVWLDRTYAPGGGSTRTVYFLNHSSWWDYLIPLLLNEFVFRQRARYMMARFMMSYRWYYRLLFQAAGAFSVSADSPAQRAASLRYAAELLEEEGTALYLYPQGKAQLESEDLRFQDGIGWLHARCAGVDFVPVAVHLHTLRTARPQLYLKVGDRVAAATSGTVAERTRLLEARCRELLRQVRATASDPLRSGPPESFVRLV